MYFIGLDVHKKTISCCVKDACGQTQRLLLLGRWWLGCWRWIVGNASSFLQKIQECSGLEARSAEETHRITRPADCQVLLIAD